MRSLKFKKSGAVKIAPFFSVKIKLIAKKFFTCFNISGVFLKGYKTMQINSIQSPNFGRLIVTKEAEPALKKCSYKTLEKLINIGESLDQTTEYIDIEIGKGLKCKLKGIKDAYFGPFVSRVFNNVKKGFNDNLLEMDHYTISRNAISDDPDACTFGVISSKDFGGIEDVEHIDELVMIAKELDNAAVQKEARTIGERVERKNAKILHNRLIKNFGE